MGLNTDFKDFDASLAAILQAHYKTDLNIIEKKGHEKIISLRAYAYIPLLGRLISYIVYKFSKQSDIDVIDSKLNGLVANYQTKATNHVNTLFTFPNPQFAGQVKRVYECYNKYASIYLKLQQNTAPSFQECAETHIKSQISAVDLKNLDEALRRHADQKGVQWSSELDAKITKVKAVAEAIETSQATLKMIFFCKEFKRQCDGLIFRHSSYQEEVQIRTEIISFTESLSNLYEQKEVKWDEVKAKFNRLVSASQKNIYLDVMPEIGKLQQEFALCYLNRHLKAISLNAESLSKFLDTASSDFLHLKEKEKAHAKVLKSIPAEVIAAHSKKLADKCQAYLTKVKHSDFYHSILRKENVTDQLTSAFTLFFTALAEHPKEMREVILCLPEKTDPEKAIKFQAFGFLLKAHYAKDKPSIDQLLPAGKEERAAFLISAFRLGMFERKAFLSFKIEALPELIKLQAEKAPKVFSNLLDQIKAQVEKKYKSQVAMKVDKSSKKEKEADDKKTQETLEAVWERIEGLKDAAEKQTPPADLTSLMDYLAKQRDFLIQILSLIPPPLLKDISLPCTKNLVWPDDTEAGIFHDCHRECEIHSALDASLTLSIFTKLKQKDKKTLDSLESFCQFFKDLALLDFRQAVDFFAQSSDFLEEEQLLDAAEILMDFYEKKNQVPFSDIPASTEKDQLLTVICNLPNDRLSNECFLILFRAIQDSRLRDSFVARFVLSSTSGYFDIKDQKGLSKMIDNLSQPYKDQVYHYKVLSRVDIQYALKIEDPKLRDEAIKFVFNQDVKWQSFEELNAFITKIADKQQFSPVFLDYIKKQIDRRVDLVFSTLVAEYIEDATIKKVANTLIQEAKKIEFLVTY